MFKHYFFLLIAIIFPSQILSDFPDSQMKSREDGFSDSNVEKELLLKAEEHFFKKRFYTARIFFEKIIARNPENAVAHSYLGDIFLYQQDWENAIRHYTIAKELLQRNTKPPLKETYRLAEAYYQKQDFARSRMYCEEVLTHYPDFYQCHFYLGLIELETFRNREKAIEHFRLYRSGLNETQLKNQNPGLAKEISIMDSLLAKLQSLDGDAPETLKKLLDPLSLLNRQQNNLQLEKKESEIRRPDTSRVTLPSGDKNFWFEYYFLKETSPHLAENRLLEYKNQMKKNPEENFLVRKELCLFYYQNKDFVKSERECQEALQWNKDQEVNGTYVLSLYAQEKYDDFEKNIKEYLQTYDRDIEMLHLYTSFLVQKERWKEALIPLKKLLYNQPDHKEGLYLEFLIYKELKENEFRKQTVQKILLFHKHDVELLRKILHELLKSQIQEQVKILSQTIYEQSKNIDDGLLLLSLYLQDSEDEEKILNLISELYRKYPDNFQIIKIIVLYFKEKNTNYDTVLKIVTDYISRNKNDEQIEELKRILPDTIKSRLPYFSEE